MKTHKYFLFLIVMLMSVSMASAWGEGLNDGLIAGYNFDEVSGDLLDITGNGFDGTVADITTREITPTFPTGINDGYFFDGTNDEITGFTNSSSVVPFGGDKGTVSIWFNASFTAGALEHRTLLSTTATRYLILHSDSGKISINIEGGQVMEYDATGLWNVGEWVNLILTWDAGSNLYINGTLNKTAGVGGSPTFDADMEIGNQIGLTRHWHGGISEVIIWNRVLNATEIALVYNSGQGDSPPPTLADDITINLLSPGDNAISSNATQNFTANFTSTNLNLTNSTYYVWFANGTLLNFTSVTGLNGTSNQTNTTFDFDIADTYTWNVQVCGINSSGFLCENATSNFTMEWRLFKEIAESYVNTTTEGSLEFFQLNLTVPSARQVSTANLIYNNTASAGTITRLGAGNYSLSINYQILNVDSNTNRTFFWNVTMEDGEQFNSTSHNQSVLAFAIDNCTTYSVLILNYTLKDEQTQEDIATTENTTIDVDLQIYPIGSTNAILTFNKTYNATNPAQICVNAETLNNTEFRINSLVRYQSQDRVSEFHNIQNATLSNATIPQNVNLLDLATEDSTTFLITFKDESFLPVEGALINVQRKYISEGIFKSVEVPMTDVNGETLAHLEVEDAIYTFIVTKNGKVLYTRKNVIAKCDNELTGDCQINLNALATGVPVIDWDTVGDITYTMTFTKSTRTVSTVFTTTDGSTRTIVLNTTKFDRFGNNTVCTDSLTSSSGTLTCVIPESYGNVTVTSKLFSNGDLVTTQVYSLAQDISTALGESSGSAKILVLVMVISIALMFVSSSIGVVIGAVMGVIMCLGIMIITSASPLGKTSSVMFLIIAGIIIVYKISERRG